MVTDADIENALTFLDETSDSIAHAKAELERSDILAKRVRERMFLSTEGTVAERKANAEIHADVATADERHLQAIVMYESLKAKRELRGIQIDVWRTQSASQRGRL